MLSASKSLHINYSSAKTIMNTYKKHGRILKKLTRTRHRLRHATQPQPEPQLQLQLQSHPQPQPQRHGSQAQGVQSPGQPSRVPSTASQSAHPAADQAKSSQQLSSDDDPHPVVPTTFNFTEYSETVLSSFNKRIEEERRYLHLRLGHLTLPLPRTFDAALPPSSRLNRSPNGSALSNSS